MSTTTAAPVYSATSTAWGGRDGRAASSDGRVELQLSVPGALGGDDGPGTNPEQLLATGWAACFHSALKGVARAQRLDVTDSAVTVTISLVASDDGFDLAARIEAEVGGVERAAAEELVQGAHARCPYSRATRGNIAQEVALVGAGA